MDASSQVFATGGASGIVMAVLWLVYRFFFSRHRVVSRCCGREFSLETEGSTPNIRPMVVKDASASPPHPSQQGLTDSSQPVGERRTGSISGENEVSVSRDGQGQTQAQPASRGDRQPPSENTKPEPLPEHAQSGWADERSPLRPRKVILSKCRR